MREPGHPLRATVACPSIENLGTATLSASCEEFEKLLRHMFLAGVPGEEFFHAKCQDDPTRRPFRNTRYLFRKIKGIIMSDIRHRVSQDAAFREAVGPLASGWCSIQLPLSYIDRVEKSHGRLCGGRTLDNQDVYCVAFESWKASAVGEGNAYRVQASENGIPMRCAFENSGHLVDHKKIMPEVRIRFDVLIHCFAFQEEFEDILKNGILAGAAVAGHRARAALYCRGL